MALRLATRGSELALAQSGHVAKDIAARLGTEVELVIVQTSGDRLAHVPLATYGGKGLFIKEIEEALLSGAADLAVHSAKDLPAKTPDGLHLAAFPTRADPRDALLCAPGGAKCLAELPTGAVVGTGSARRRMWLQKHFPALEVRALRGNVTTRVKRLDAGDFDAMVLACAGLDRLGMGERIDERIAPELLLPAVGQGVLAIETRAATALADDLEVMNDPQSEHVIHCEREVLRGLDADCNVPLSAFAERGDDGVTRLRAALGLPDGTRIETIERFGRDARRLGRETAETLRASGGEAILRKLREDAGLD